MSDQYGRQVPALPHPSPEDTEAWKAYWNTQGQLWRTEPEIDTNRQEELTQCRAIVPDIEKGRYPFKDMKLSRADVEWLLATHESGGIRGPVDWSDESQREREGLDLRGADLQQKDLSGLPLARIRGGIATRERIAATEEQENIAGILLEGANLAEAQLQRACLLAANLSRANLSGASLNRAELSRANLQFANLERAKLGIANLSEADLGLANLHEAELNGAHMEGASLIMAHLEEADATNAHLERAILSGAHLQGAFLGRVFFDQGTYLTDVVLSNTALLESVRWGGVDLSVANWTSVSTPA